MKLKEALAGKACATTGWNDPYVQLVYLMAYLKGFEEAKARILTECVKEQSIFVSPDSEFYQQIKNLGEEEHDTD